MQAPPAASLRESLSFATLRRLLSTYDALAILSGIWFMVLFVRYLIPPLFPHFQSVYGIGSTETGLLLTVLMTCYATMQFPSGALSDRFARHRVIAAGTVLFSLAALLVTVADGYWFLVVAVGLVGVGTGAYKTVALNVLSSVYADRSGQAIGFMDTVGQFGGVLAPAVIVALLSTALGWRLGFVLSAAVGFALAGLTERRVAPRAAAANAGDGGGDTGDVNLDDGGTEAVTDADGGDAGVDADPPSDAPPADSTRLPTYLTPFLDPSFSAFVGVCMLHAFTWGGLTAFLTLYLIEQKAFPSSVATLVYGGLFVMTLGQLVTGRLGDRVGPLPVVAGLFTLASVAAAGLLLARTVVAVAVAVFLLGAGMHGFRPVRSAYLVEAIPADIGGGTLGIVRTTMTAASAVAPVVVGVLADRFGYGLSFEVLGASVGLGALLAVAVTVRARGWPSVARGG